MKKDKPTKNEPRTIKVKILLTLMSIWVILGFLNVFYNTYKTISEAKQWLFISDQEKRYKIFGDLYTFFIDINKDTPNNTHVLIYSKDVRTFYLGIYYLYPRIISTVDSIDKFTVLTTSKNYNYIAIYNEKIPVIGYKEIRKYRSKSSKSFWIIYKKL